MPKRTKVYANVDRLFVGAAPVEVTMLEAIGEAFRLAADTVYNQQIFSIAKTYKSLPGIGLGIPFNLQSFVGDSLQSPRKPPIIVSPLHTQVVQGRTSGWVCVDST